MIWFTQTHQYFRRVRSPIFFVLPLYLAIYAVFEGAWRMPVFVALAAMFISQVVFTLFTLRPGGRIRVRSSHRLGRAVADVAVVPHDVLDRVPAEPARSAARIHSPGIAEVISEAVVH